MTKTTTTITTTTTTTLQQSNSAREREEGGAGSDGRWMTTELTRMRGNNNVVDVHVLEELGGNYHTHMSFIPLSAHKKSPSY
jgi:hypothetical protein